jgi:uncharacterized phage protein gp47/JayE
MAYSAPTVGPSGLTINSYQDILAYYLAGFQSIYGNTVYLGNDSADYQLMSLVALAAADCNSALQLAYNEQSPATAVGAGLDLIVAINGLQRKTASYSTCTVTLTGTAGTVIANGVISDINGNLWNLPSSVTIGGGGTASAVATSQQVGSINITAPNQLVNIVTPQAGWVSVNNGSNVAVLGQPIETDGQLRARQAISTELPSVDLAAGTIAAILAVPGVTRINNGSTLSSSGTTSFENFTGSTDSFGNPAHSISPVVQGGSALAIATAIYNNRGLGVLTNGSTGGTLVSTPITDPLSGITININFATPTMQIIYVSMEVHVLAGGTFAVLQPLIQAAVAAYLNNLPLGSVVSFGELVSAANSQNPVGAAPIYSVRAASFFFGTSASPSTNTDITLNFYQAAQGVAADVVITSV